jgi:hypothetical protein
MTSTFETMRGKEKHPLTEFYQKEGVEQKSELDREDIKNCMEIEYQDNYFATEWKVELHLTQFVTEPFERKMVSNERKGRTEGMEVMKAQELHIGEEARTKGLVDRMLGR